MKKAHRMASAVAGASTLCLAIGLTHNVNAADKYWDGDQIAGNGPLINDYAGNPDPSVGLGGIIGSGYNRFNTQADGLGSLSNAAAGDKLFFGYGTSVGTEVVLRGHTTGILGSVNIGPNDNYRFSDRTITGWTGLQLGAGGTVNVEGSSTATFDVNSLAAGSSIGVKNGTGTLIYRLGDFTRDTNIALNGGELIVEQGSMNNGGIPGMALTGAGKLSFRSTGNYTATSYSLAHVWGGDANNTHTGGFQLYTGVLDARGSTPGASAMGTGTLTIGGDDGVNATVYMENTTISNAVETSASGTGGKYIQSAGASNTLNGGLTLNDDLTVNGAQLNVNGLNVDGSSGQILGTSLIGLSGTVNVASGTYRLDNTGATFASTSAVAQKDGEGTLENAMGYFDHGESVVITDGVYLIEQATVNSGSGGVISGSGQVAFRSSGGDFTGTAYDFSRVWGIDTNNTHTGGYQLLNGVLDARGSGASSSAMGTGKLTIGGESGNAVIYMENTTISNEVETAASGTGKKVIQVQSAGTLNNGLTLNDSLLKTGNATLTVNNGMTVNNASTVTVDSANFAVNGGTTLNATATFDGVGTATLAGGVTGTGGIVVDNTSVRLFNTNTYSGETRINTGSTLILGEANVTSENSIISLQGGTFDSVGGGNSGQIVRGIEGNGSFNMDGNTTALSIRTQAGDDNSFSGTWSLANTAMTITVSGQNGEGTQSFDSAVGTIARFDVTSGATVKINDSIEVNGTGFVVESGSTLGGDSDITGNILVGDNVAGDAFIAAGNSIGTMNVDGNVDFSFKNDGSMISEINADTNAADLLDATGNVTFGSGSVIYVDNIAGTLEQGDSFDLVNGTIVNGGLVTFNFDNAALGGGLSWDTSSFAATGGISVVPELSSYALIAGLFGMMYIMVRRRR